MIGAALALYAVLLGVVFGLRPWLQYRRTGDHGFRGFSGDVSLLERAAGLLFTLSLVGLLAAGTAQWLGVVTRSALPAGTAVPGLLLMITGFVVVVVAQQQMGANWRVGVEPTEATTLVTSGLFAWVRNPVFSGIGLFAIGFSLVVPNPISALALLVGAIGLEIQVRWAEEPYLTRVHGEAYTEYVRRVGRFVPVPVGPGRFISALVSPIGLFVAAVGLLGVLAPSQIRSMLGDWRTLTNLPVVVGLRIVLGVVFMVAAPACRLPAFVRGVAWLEFAAAGVILYLGPSGLVAFVDWWLERPPLFVRLWCSGALVFGLLLLYAGRRYPRAT